MHPLQGKDSLSMLQSQKIDKYHIKTYKVVDSSNNYCLMFALYTGVHNYPLTEKLMIL